MSRPVAFAGELALGGRNLAGAKKKEMVVNLAKESCHVGDGFFWFCWWWGRKMTLLERFGDDDDAEQWRIQMIDCLVITRGWFFWVFFFIK